MQAVIDIIAWNAKGSNQDPLEYLADHPIKVIPPSDCYMRLCIERIGSGPRGMPHISVAHYYELNGDLCSDPEITFEVIPEGWKDPAFWGPTSFQMLGSGIYRQCVYRKFEGESVEIVAIPTQVRDNISFAKTWSTNIREQGFVQAFKAQSPKRV